MNNDYSGGNWLHISHLQLIISLSSQLMTVWNWLEGSDDPIGEEVSTFPMQTCVFSVATEIYGISRNLLFLSRNYANSE